MNAMQNKVFRIAVIGAGVRGTSLARKVFTSGFPARVIAVAEPDPLKRKAFLDEFSIPDKYAYTGWEEMIDNLRDCDATIIATLDNQHTGPAIASLNKGWHILIEKPLADTFKDTRKIADLQKEKNRVVAVCHTLRFMEGYRKVKELIDKGTVGELIHIEHMEAISNMRFAHNYVRGRWSQEKHNTFLLLHKCSHDIDFVNWLFKESCIKVSSFGNLKFFTPVNAPEGSAMRCTDGCRIAESCPYYAVRLYTQGNLEEWPARDICNNHNIESHLNVLRNGPYGLCVWHAGNDVVDHQVVMMEFKGGATATCTLTGYSATNGRRVRIQGSEGEILFDEAAGTITVNRFYGAREEVITLPLVKTYHPEDQDIVNEWLLSVFSSASVTVDAAEALRTHAVVFAAERSRIEGRTIKMSELLSDSDN